MKRETLILALLFCCGCASEAPVALLTGFSEEGAPVCLEDRKGIPAIVQKFYATRDLTTEEGKIDYLIDRVRNSNLIFIRNRVQYTGPAASEFLRWKLGRMERRYGIKIRTVQDFISEVVSGSRRSGEPYVVVFADGSRRDFQSVLQNELDALEACLKQYAPKVEGVHLKEDEGEDAMAVIGSSPGGTANQSKA